MNTFNCLMIIAFLIFSSVGHAGTGVAIDLEKAQAYTPAPENLKARERFQDNKFGIFLHWGLYSQLGGVGSPYGAEWIMEDLRISGPKYQRLAEFFNPTGFDAEQWVKAFKDAGAKYIVITSKHHDGFAMYDSKVSNFDIVDSTPYKKDPIKELANSAHKHGLQLFFYYSHLDWHHPDYYPWGRTGHYTKREKVVTGKNTCNFKMHN
ncbi:alpha-L-fucosidase [Pseudoalteromonas sp. CH_XMU1449-3]|uniref:alpha-L-fucosidase n=1 Tax=Pseudoalteromonas sp. CH_XMU1449-3 TaxID=3107774 RepID=UPI00300A1BB0